MTREQKTKICEHFDWLHTTASNVPDDLKDVLKAAYLAGAAYALDIYCPHWISVEEELPKDYEPVLAAFANHFARVCFHCGETWYLNKPLAAEEMEGITHWMPLPAPPSCSEIPNNHIIDVNKKVDRVIGTPEHIQTALDVLNKKGGKE